MEPNHHEIRAFDDTTTEMMGDFYESLGLDRNQENWAPGTSRWLTNIMSDPDKTEYTKAMGSKAKPCQKQRRMTRPKIFQYEFSNIGHT